MPLEKTRNPASTDNQQGERSDISTRFKPGQSGNPKGREKGSRNKLGEIFIKELYLDFQENGIEAIKTVREEKPDVYLRVIAQIVEKDINVNPSDDLAQVASDLSATAQFLKQFADEGQQAGIAAGDSDTQDDTGSLLN